MEVGPGVSNFRPGDDVALEPGIPCWYNRASRRGALPAALLHFVAEYMRESLLMDKADMCHTACREGRYNLDPDVTFFATPPVHGSLAEVRSRLYSCSPPLSKAIEASTCSVRHM